jgi:hypothetical protein
MIVKYFNTNKKKTLIKIKYKKIQGKKYIVNSLQHCNILI